MTRPPQTFSPPKKEIAGIRRRVLAWYDRQGRDLPWRRTRDPYHIWISEIMLQQTQVRTVIPYFERFMERFPTVQDLALAPAGDVLKAWEGLGYYTRARNIHRAARGMVERFEGQVPGSREELLSLPGVGPYVAGAVSSIGFNQPEAAVDGNVRRVFSRVFMIEEPMDRGPAQRLVAALAEDLVPKRRPGDFNQALMDLGAMLCTPKKPQCRECPLRTDCRAQQAGRQDELPLKGRRPAVPHRWSTAAVIRDTTGKLLVTQRPPTGLLGGLWKLPGGLCEDQSSLRTCLREQVRAELGVEIRVKSEIGAVHHQYTHFRMTLTAFHCTLTRGEPAALGCADWRRLDWNDLDRLAFSKAEYKIMALLIRE